MKIPKANKALPVIGLVFCIVAAIANLVLILRPEIPVSMFCGISFNYDFIPRPSTPYTAYIYLTISVILCFMSVILQKAQNVKSVIIISAIILAAGFSLGNFLDNLQFSDLLSPFNTLSFFFEVSAVSHVFSNITLTGAFFILSGAFMRIKSENTVRKLTIISSVSLAIYLSAAIIICLTSNNEFYLLGYTFIPSSVLFIILNILAYKGKSGRKDFPMAVMLFIVTMIFSPFISMAIIGERLWVIAKTALCNNADYFIPLWFIGALLSTVLSYKGDLKNENPEST